VNRWFDNSPGPTDEGNRPGHWPGGWLKGEWKCPRCGTIIGRNLRGQIPWAPVAEHKERCKEPEDIYMDLDGKLDRGRAGEVAWPG